MFWMNDKKVTVGGGGGGGEGGRVCNPSPRLDTVQPIRVEVR